MTGVDQILRDVEAAAAHRHPRRAMRVLLECGHLRLMPWNVTVLGVGAVTSCGLCPRAADGHYTARMVVDVAETGVLWSDTYGLKDSR